ncbi:MAG: hypothetical protein J7K82_08865 [Thermoproteales archaeon]|nr:hypothetical protein [Thermoproteales archaeon]
MSQANKTLEGKILENLSTMNIMDMIREAQAGKIDTTELYDILVKHKIIEFEFEKDCVAITIDCTSTSNNLTFVDAVKYAFWIESDTLKIKVIRYSNIGIDVSDYEVELNKDLIDELIDAFNSDDPFEAFNTLVYYSLFP